jgi:hypothetical protein
MYRELRPDSSEIALGPRTGLLRRLAVEAASPTPGNSLRTGLMGSAHSRSGGRSLGHRTGRTFHRKVARHWSDGLSWARRMQSGLWLYSNNALPPSQPGIEGKNELRPEGPRAVCSRSILNATRGTYPKCPRAVPSVENRQMASG